MRPTPPHIRKMIRTARPVGGGSNDNQSRFRDLRAFTKRARRGVGRVGKDVGSHAIAPAGASGGQAWGKVKPIAMEAVVAVELAFAGVISGVQRLTRAGRARPMMVAGFAGFAALCLLGMSAGMMLRGGSEMEREPANELTAAEEPADAVASIRGREGRPEEMSMNLDRSEPGGATAGAMPPRQERSSGAAQQNEMSRSSSAATGSGAEMAQADMPKLSPSVTAVEPEPEMDPATAKSTTDLPGGEDADANADSNSLGTMATASATASDDGGLVYLVDVSGSLIDSLPHALRWLDVAIRELPADRRFTVLLFRDGQVAEVPPAGMKLASQENKRAVREWINPSNHQVEAHGRSSFEQALERANEYDPAELFILSDDTFASRGALRNGPEMISALSEAIGDSGMRINTVQFFYRGDNGTLQAIAERFGGSYEFVTSDPKASTASKGSTLLEF